MSLSMAQGRVDLSKRILWGSIQPSILSNVALHL